MNEELMVRTEAATDNFKKLMNKYNRLMTELYKEDILSGRKTLTERHLLELLTLKLEIDQQKAEVFELLHLATVQG